MGRMFMYRLMTCFFLAIILFLSPTLATAVPQADTVTLIIGDSIAQVDGEQYEMVTAPQVINGVTMVPIRFITEAFGANVTWHEDVGEITVRLGGTLIRLQPGNNNAVIDGTAYVLPVATVMGNGFTLVPLRFLAENLNYQVQYLPSTGVIQINQLPPPNRPPVAEFTVQKDVVAQGETVIYEDQSYDPDGDQITEIKWNGKVEAFFEPGEYRVTLTVIDSHGSWSEPFSRVITVTEEVKMNKLTYSLHNPVPGEPLDISHIPVLTLKKVDPAVTMSREKIIISNSPETVREDGILYSDVSSGDNRIYYHHLNGSTETKTIYLLAVNQGINPVKLTVKKWGSAGPSDPMAVGRMSAYSYLDFTGKAHYEELQPGEVLVFNEGINNIIPPGQTVNGMFDVRAENELLFAVVVAGDTNTVEELINLPVLPRDGLHIRGTFNLAQRYMSVVIKGGEPACLVVADGKEDLYLYGKDYSSSELGLVTKDKGNYGLAYHIKIRSEQRVGVILNPRGGIFVGAGKWDGKAFYIPNRGILKPQTEGALIGVIEPGREKVFTFIPPAGSYLPVRLVFLPF